MAGAPSWLAAMKNNGCFCSTTSVFDGKSHGFHQVGHGFHNGVWENAPVRWSCRQGLALVSASFFKCFLCQFFSSRGCCFCRQWFQHSSQTLQIHAGHGFKFSSSTNFSGGFMRFIFFFRAWNIQGRIILQLCRCGVSDKQQWYSLRDQFLVNHFHARSAPCAGDLPMHVECLTCFAEGHIAKALIFAHVGWEALSPHEFLCTKISCFARWQYKKGCSARILLFCMFSFAQKEMGFTHVVRFVFKSFQVFGLSLTFLQVLRQDEGWTCPKMKALRSSLQYKQFKSLDLESV